MQSSNLRGLRLALIGFGASLLAACGGGAGGGLSGAAPPGMAAPTACTNCGGALVTLTDAPGDFLSYIVNVVSLQLTRADGTTVQTLPMTTTVDFSQLVNLSEIVSAAQVPAGSYVSASITLDYSSATIVVDNGSGGVTIAANQIIDGQTMQPLVKPNSTMTLSLSLPAGAPLVVTPGTVANLALDFNLAASNAITPSTTNPSTVTVNPVLTGSLVPDQSKQIRVRGSLVSTDATAGTYTVDVHPFDDDSGNSGQYTVATTPTTSFTINGVNYTGAAGLAELATNPASTMTVAYGTLDKTTMAFTATNVQAGSSVVGASRDGIQGSVLARSGDTVTLADDDVMHAQLANDMHYVPQVIATIGSGTTVTELGRSGAYNIQDISVGQRVQFTGKLATDASGNATLDASTGSAMLLPTRITGTVGTVGVGSLTLALQSIDGQPAASFNFSGTGSTSAQDALAATYVAVLPAALSTSSLTPGTTVSLQGFVAPFGSAPPDFNATTVVDFGNAQAEVAMHWPAPGEIAPFAILTDAQASIGPGMLTAADEFSMHSALTEIHAPLLSVGLTLTPDMAASNPKFVIIHQVSEKANSYTTFNDFVTALIAELNGTTGMVGLAAAGPYDAATSTISVDQMIVMMND